MRGWLATLVLLIASPAFADNGPGWRLYRLSSPSGAVAEAVAPKQLWVWGIDPRSGRRVAVSLPQGFERLKKDGDRFQLWVRSPELGELRLELRQLELDAPLRIAPAAACAPLEGAVELQELPGRVPDTRLSSRARAELTKELEDCDDCDFDSAAVVRNYLACPKLGREHARTSKTSPRDTFAEPSAFWLEIPVDAPRATNRSACASYGIASACDGAVEHRLVGEGRWPPPEGTPVCQSRRSDRSGGEFEEAGVSSAADCELLAIGTSVECFQTPGCHASFRWYAWGVDAAPRWSELRPPAGLRRSELRDP